MHLHANPSSCIFQILPPDWLLSLTGSVEHAPALRLVLHVPKCRQAVLKAVPDRDHSSDSTLAESAREGASEGEGEREWDGGEREILLLRRVHIRTMASDPGLLPLLVWTISMQVLSSRGTASNEGKRACASERWWEASLSCVEMTLHRAMALHFKICVEHCEMKSRDRKTYLGSERACAKVPLGRLELIEDVAPRFYLCISFVWWYFCKCMFACIVNKHNVAVSWYV